MDLIGGPQQLVVFRLDTREYALSIDQTVEAVRMVALAPLAGAPSWLPGMINLRGRVIPVMDLRTRLGLSAQTPGLDNAIVIVRVDDRIVGLIVDQIVEILTVLPEALTPPDRLAGVTHAVTQVAHIGARLIMVLDMAILTSSMESLLSNV